jgi:hypothetical protein
MSDGGMGPGIICGHNDTIPVDGLMVHGDSVGGYNV